MLKKQCLQTTPYGSKQQNVIWIESPKHKCAITASTTLLMIVLWKTAVINVNLLNMIVLVFLCYMHNIELNLYTSMHLNLFCLWVSSALVSPSPCFIYLSLAELMAVGWSQGENMAPFQNYGRWALWEIPNSYEIGWGGSRGRCAEGWGCEWGLEPETRRENRWNYKWGREQRCSESESQRNCVVTKGL